MHMNAQIKKLLLQKKYQGQKISLHTTIRLSLIRLLNYNQKYNLQISSLGKVFDGLAKPVV